MQSYKTNLLREVMHHLKNGGVIAYPTESCYGLGCDPFNPKAIAKILKIKGRSKTKGLIVVAGNIKQLDKLISPLSINDKESIKAFWPGFYSIIMPTTHNVPKILTGNHKKIAVRVSTHDLIKQLCQYLNSPLVSTSANRSGFKPIKTYRECSRQFKQHVMVLPGRIGFAKKPSTIFDWKTKEVLR